MLDYEAIKLSFSDEQKRLYETLYMAGPMLLKHIWSLFPKNIHHFNTTLRYYDFLTFYQKPLVRSNAIERWDSEVTRFIRDDTDFVRFVKDYQNNKYDRTESSIIKCYIHGLFNPTRNGLTKLDVLYNDFLKSTKNKIVEISIDSEKTEFLENKMTTIDTPFYESEEYKYALYKKVKQEFADQYCKKQVNYICSTLLWNHLINGDKIKYGDIVKEFMSISSVKYSRMQVYRVLSRVHREILEFISSNDEALEVFDSGSVIQIDGKNYGVKDALKYALTFFDDIRKVSVVKKEPKMKIESGTDDSIKEQIISLCKKLKIPYNDRFGTYTHGIIKLKFSDGIITQKFNFFVYNGGG